MCITKTVSLFSHIWCPPAHLSVTMMTGNNGLPARGLSICFYDGELEHGMFKLNHFLRMPLLYRHLSLSSSHPVHMLDHIHTIWSIVTVVGATGYL